MAKVKLKIVAGSGNNIPVPERPRPQDHDPASYIPQGMSEADREALRAAAEEWTSMLSGLAARMVPGRSEAAVNMRHFRTGKGRDRELSITQTQTILDDLNNDGKKTRTSAVGQFLDLIRDDMMSVEGRRYYIAINDGPSANNGTPWFGVYAGGGSFYAVGGALLGFGAVATGSRSHITIFYREYIYDRYNWDRCKSTKIPHADALDWLMDEDVVQKAATLTNVCGTPFILRNDEENVYVVQDDLMGSLVADKTAANYDIVGSGSIKTVRILRQPPGGQQGRPAAPSPQAPAQNQRSGR